MKTGWLWETTDGYVVTAGPRLADALALAVDQALAEKSEAGVKSVVQLGIVCVENDLPEYEAWLADGEPEVHEGK